MKLTSSQIKNTSVISGTTVTDSLNTLHTLVGGGGGGGTTNHGALTGLLADDHPQYHTDARGDARYAPLSHTQAATNAHAANNITNTPAGGITATNVQAAINELDSEKVGKTGDTMTGALNWATPVTIASAATTQIGLAASNIVYVTGTTAITSLGTIAAGVVRSVTFSSALVLTHNATSLILPGGTNITTEAGDVAEFLSLGGGDWRCTVYMRASASVDRVSGTTTSPLDHGAAGDGTTDDTAALQTTLNAAAGRIVDLLGKTYKITASLAVPSNTTLINGTLNGASMVNGDTLLEAYGSLGSAIPMSAISTGASSFVVSSASGITADGFLYLESTTIFGSGATKNGELIKVRSVAGTTVTPYRRVYDYYQAGQQFYKPTMKHNITLRNVRFIGGGNGLNHTAVHALLCENVVFDHCHSTNFGDRHFQVQRCLNARFTGCHMEHSDDATGLSYGIVVANGCDKVTITGCTGIDMRHAVTIGAENGVDRHVAVTGCTFTGCTDSAIDTHSQAQYITITGNTCGADSTLNSQDGLVVQGTDCVVTGNVVTGFDRVGILLQPLCVNNNLGDTTTCTGNIVTASSAGAVDAFGLSYDNQRTGGSARVNISGNTINMPNTQGYGINFEIAAGGSTVTGLVMNNNNVYTRRTGIRIFTAANKFLRSSVIVGNSVESLAASGYDTIEITATTNNYIERLMIAANSIYGGRYGIGVTGVSRVVANSNMIQTFGVAATNGTFAATADNFTT